MPEELKDKRSTTKVCFPSGIFQNIMSGNLASAKNMPISLIG